MKIVNVDFRALHGVHLSSDNVPMYVKRIHTQNVGPLSELTIEPRLTEDGNPVPIVIVGQNGAGKSLTLSVILDAMTEMRRSVFNNIPEVEGAGYLRISAKRYIRQISDYSLAEVIVGSESHNASFREIIARTSGREIQENHPQLITLATEDERWLDGGFYKIPNVPDILKNQVEKENFLYFPYFRYEKAAWIAETANIDFIRENNLYGQANLNPVRTSIIEETRRWILNVLLDRELYEKHLPTIPLQFGEGNTTQVTLFAGYNGPNATLFMLINEILAAMLRAKDQTLESARLGIGTKRNRDISVYIKKFNEPEIVAAPDIGMLSSGELMTIALATEIIRAYEIAKGSPPSSLSEVTGIVLIDEIDLHLHISFQKAVLPAIIRRFPKVQFITTTHSPFFVLGMQETGETDIISLPIGNKITIEEFSEFQESYNLFIEKNAQFKSRYDDLNKKLLEEGRPLIITEGKTDWQHTKDALSRAQSVGNYTDVDVEFFEFADPITMGDIKLKQMCESISLLPQRRKLIFMFDRDKPEIIKNMSGEPAQFKLHGNQVYSFCLPIPPHRVNYNNISIEFYYKDDDLRTIDPNTGKRLWFTNEIDKNVSLTTNKAVIKTRVSPIIEEEMDKKVHDSNIDEIKNEKGDKVALSKSLFVSQIIYNNELSANFNRTAFNVIFEVIRKILNDPVV